MSKSDVTETLQGCGFNIEVTVQVSEKDYKHLPDELLLANGRRLNVNVRGRLPLCHRVTLERIVEHPKTQERAEKEDAGAVNESGSNGQRYV